MRKQLSGLSPNLLSGVLVAVEHFHSGLGRTPAHVRCRSGDLATGII
jgi:hypothetical protein